MLPCRQCIYHCAVVLVVNEWLSGLCFSDRPVDRVYTRVCVCACKTGGSLALSLSQHPALWVGHMAACLQLAAYRHKYIFISHVPVCGHMHALLLASKPFAWMHKSTQIPVCTGNKTYTDNLNNLGWQARRCSCALGCGCILNKYIWGVLENRVEIPLLSSESLYFMLGILFSTDSYKVSKVFLSLVKCYFLFFN